ncbi:MAG: MarR family winged helix-turn-helix transcriptional regulator [Bacteroidota bacterium]
MDHNPSPFSPDQQSNELSSKIVLALERLGEVFRASLWKQAKVHKISPIQIRILIFVAYHEPKQLRTVSSLAAEFQLTRPTISDAVRVLYQKDFLAKEPDPTDSRSYSLSLTSKGQALLKEIEQFAAPIQAVIKGMPIEKQQSLFAGLLPIIDQLEVEGEIHTQRMCQRCHYFSVGQGPDPAYCNLLERALNPPDLRLDCPEFLPSRL